MGFSLKKLAQMCLQAEMEYAHAGLTIEPRFVLNVIGKTDADQVHVLSGMEGRHLMGLQVSYSSIKDGTNVLVRCSQVRDFFIQMGNVPEDFVEESWIEEIRTIIQAAIPIRLGTAGSC
jgi:hypothetical protein